MPPSPLTEAFRGSASPQSEAEHGNDAARITAAAAGSAYFANGSGCDSETHSAAPLRSALTVSDSLGGARRVLALFCVVGYEVDGIIGKWLWRCQLLPGG